MAREPGWAVVSDRRIVLAAILAVGFMGLIALAMYAPIKPESQRIVDGSLGMLGAALVNAVTGIFRTDRADETRADNTGKALDAISAGIAATPHPQEPRQ